MRCFTNNYAEHLDNLDLAQKLATHISKENPRAHARRLVSCAPLFHHREKKRCLQIIKNCRAGSKPLKRSVRIASLLKKSNKRRTTRPRFIFHFHRPAHPRQQLLLVLQSEPLGRGERHDAAGLCSSFLSRMSFSHLLVFPNDSHFVRTFMMANSVCGELVLGRKHGAGVGSCGANWSVGRT
jgi:hypothetical protein